MNAVRQMAAGGEAEVAVAAGAVLGVGAVGGILTCRRQEERTLTRACCLTKLRRG